MALLPVLSPRKAEFHQRCPLTSVFQPGYDNCHSSLPTEHAQVLPFYNQSKTATPNSSLTLPFSSCCPGSRSSGGASHSSPPQLSSLHHLPLSERYHLFSVASPHHSWLAPWRLWCFPLTALLCALPLLVPSRLVGLTPDALLILFGTCLLSDIIPSDGIYCP